MLFRQGSAWDLYVYLIKLSKQSDAKWPALCVLLAMVVMIHDANVYNNG